MTNDKMPKDLYQKYNRMRNLGNELCDLQEKIMNLSFVLQNTDPSLIVKEDLLRSQLASMYSYQAILWARIKEGAY